MESYLSGDGAGHAVEGFGELVAGVGGDVAGGLQHAGGRVGRLVQCVRHYVTRRLV